MLNSRLFIAERLSVSHQQLHIQIYHDIRQVQVTLFMPIPFTFIIFSEYYLASSLVVSHNEQYQFIQGNYLMLKLLTEQNV